jgi:hypothetical protein
MDTYIIREEEYRVICSVHNKIRYLIINSDMNEDTKKHVLELIDVANQMAINMENALERKREFGIGLFSFDSEDNDE